MMMKSSKDAHHRHHHHASSGKQNASEQRLFDIVKSGTMVKRSQNKKRFTPVNYKQRWFELTKHWLTYYDVESLEVSCVSCDVWPSGGGEMWVGCTPCAIWEGLDGMKGDVCANMCGLFVMLYDSNSYAATDMNFFTYSLI